ncbi:aminopeptidase N [Glaciecola sp. MH2013]|uniref:aminopeptidase N n=1 Tax=Glaciecola sp. MH2013 TaxID=2785524 RepID=UPI0018A073DA|nr:aminopeptidase N [Glaciecola sp. MH2013]MBF7072790.1 aminopeptidase N [Glaciecola sp. MH2013]
MTKALSKKRSEYRAPSYLVDAIKLDIALDPNNTKVHSRLSCSVNQDTQDGADFVLDGNALTLSTLKLNGKECQNYHLGDDALVIHGSALKGLERFELDIENCINPSENASLEGLYLSNEAYCTQCEAEGFRKITYFPDRPDILSIYTVTISANRDRFPHILSNGDLIRSASEGNIRTVTWHDPHPKPCYLFALVAGDFDKLTDKYITMSGKEVSLELFVDKGKASQGYHALSSLKKSMKWDEDTFGLEYDLNTYMIVAVDFFNMGAMENKGLNVFNSKYVLADASSATDDDFFNIEAIIGHEYFHNWTGNRVTCRDWFQLSLKEGLTVFRDQQFSADMFSSLATRISQVKVMREHQFAEDAGPMSHPIRPDEVMEMNNFYTVTVYDKGAEVIRMLHTLLSEQGFRKGMDLYFLRHDGQAVTCDDFVNAMQDANDIDLSHFKRWYSQSGTPQVKVKKTHCLEFSQYTAPTADQKEKTALYIPIKMECIGTDGLPLDLGLTNNTFVLDKSKASLELTTNDYVPVLLSDFSAPVQLDYDYTNRELLVIINHASSDYSRWDAAQQLYVNLIRKRYSSEPNEHDEELVLSEFQSAILRSLDNHELCNELLSVPSVESLLQKFSKPDPLLLNRAREEFLLTLSNSMYEFLLSAYEKNNVNVPYEYNKRQVNQRRLANAILLLLASSKNDQLASLIAQRYEIADNMTDKLGSIKAAQILESGLFERLMQRFEEEYGNNSVVMDKWFALHASAPKDDCLARLQLLAGHKQFNIKNPNKVRSLVGSFAYYNTQGFHAKDGSGYRYLADYLLELDEINPQVASRLVTPLIQRKQYSKEHDDLMKRQLERLMANKSLSKDLFEKVSKSLLT